MHRDIANPYLSDPNAPVEHEGNLFRPICFRLTRGRSEPVQWVFNYVADEEHVYFVHTTKTSQPPKLRVLSRASPSEFRAVHWDVATDGERVFHRDRASRAVKRASAFRRVVEELPLYTDDEAFYDRYVRVMDVDTPTFTPVPMSPARRERTHAAYNAYLESQGRQTLPTACAARYYDLAVDRRTLYVCNPTIQLFEPLSPEERVARCEGETADDLRCFFEEHPEAATWPWAPG